MKNKIRKNKFIIITMILYIVISLLFGNKSYATEDSTLIVTLPAINNIVDDGYKWMVAYCPSETTYHLVSFDGDLTYTGNISVKTYSPSTGDPETWEVGLSHQTYCYWRDGTHLKRYYLNKSTNTWDIYQDKTTSPSREHFDFDFGENLCASNFDFKNNLKVVGNENTVFQKATTLSTLRGTHLNQETWKATKMILIVMVAIIGLLIFLLGLKKGFQILVNGLKI